MRLLIIGHDAVSVGAYSIRLRALVRWLSSRGHEVTLVSAVVVPPDDELRSTCRRFLVFPFQRSSLRSGRLLQHLFNLPDPFAPWARKVAREIQNIDGANRPDLILVSSPPHGIQLLGIALARYWEATYVADLRDDWVGNHRTRWLTPLHRMTARRAEDRMIRAASSVIANTPLMREQFLTRHPWASAKVATVTNGFNEEEFTGLAPTLRAGDRFRVGYVGSDYNGFVPSILTDVAQRWVTIGEDSKWRLVVCPGQMYAPTCLPREMWEFLPLMAPGPSAAVMTGCDVLLLFMPPGEKEPSPTVPLKAYSYLRTGLPVVYCGEAGATTELLGSFAGTFCLPRSTGDQLADFLISHKQFWGRRYPRERIDFYSFEQVSLRLEALLLHTVEAHGKTEGR